MSDNPYQSPIAEDAVEGESPEYVTAGKLARRGTRLIAVIVDGIVLGFATAPLQYYFEYGFFQAPIERPEDINPFNPFTIYAQMSPVALVASFICPIAVYLLLNGYLLWSNGQTVGKKAFGIKIVCKDGSKAEFHRLILHRYLALTVIVLVPIAGNLFVLLDPLFIFRKSRYCLHDDIADTVVVVDPR